MRHNFINIQEKLNKYHFALEKIDEENTPGPTPSEYSKLERSSRSGKGSSEGGGTNSTGTKKKKDYKHFAFKDTKEV